MINWNSGIGFKQYTPKEFRKGLIPKIESDSREWLFVENHMSQFGITDYTSAFQCPLCEKTGEGFVVIAQKYKRRTDDVRYPYMCLCYKCAVPLCKNPNEVVCYMLNRIDEQHLGLIKGSIWRESYTNKNEWVNIDGGFFSVGRYKRNPNMYWARKPCGFMEQKFISLAAAKAGVMKKTLESIPVFRKKLEILYDPNSSLPKSKEQKIYEENEL